MLNVDAIKTSSVKDADTFSRCTGGFVSRSTVGANGSGMGVMASKLSRCGNGGLLIRFAVSRPKVTVVSLSVCMKVSVGFSSWCSNSDI